MPVRCIVYLRAQLLEYGNIHASKEGHLDCDSHSAPVGAPFNIRPKQTPSNCPIGGRSVPPFAAGWGVCARS